MTRVRAELERDTQDATIPPSIGPGTGTPLVKAAGSARPVTQVQPIDRRARLRAQERGDEQQRDDDREGHNGAGDEAVWVAHDLKRRPQGATHSPKITTVPGVHSGRLTPGCSCAALDPGDSI
jgi:hypothetical protein